VITGSTSDCPEVFGVDFPFQTQLPFLQETVPAGSYVVLFTLDLFNTNFDLLGSDKVVEVSCGLAPVGGAPIGDATVVVHGFNDTPRRDEATVTYHTVASFNQSTTMGITCVASQMASPINVFVLSTRLTAIPVGLVQ
jgi:hypothetical protein